ncbi:ABC transporter ATP-binding protein [Bradyrhizobium canariense]|uniref:ABC transporter ATP-binding protein n=1 Tax=Bradyrhizobium TaxID=374 RepID=UPI000A191074|nr:ABC transporter ATP-binding protein [Bradyrhizobium canariense]OSI33689.1 Fe3+/spermidine/putrescine ABC transporter ATP-binding protein [Bradyrhizobium canariense]OSI36910.1 Fe3+/spermidine/putrescine ABC transporter ATP-binding protein [Bradyrhizobium canariense]OSI50938.1 Fe3+/spermidine/putrescine ABC transporter ATP-binding protein [Bradyrhizobium canariense]OSI57418.1 Fe3+/spermidine/putrescine ABC transporter ATP-binding protein [Bradyrhizobium canariense]OSI60569.1 Fe3+/spermidine/p
MLALSEGKEDAVSESNDFVVELRSVSKLYGDAAAVADISLKARRGELLCLLGPSGCGKTTTLRMVAGFVEPSSGSIHINNIDMTHQPPYRRDTGMVFQSYALFPHMTVAENVAFGLENLRWPREKRDKRVEEMLELVELPHFAQRLPSQLSGGQQQRIALARALAIKPAVLLLDEPFSNLDAQLRVRMREELQEVVRSVNVTTLFVTHDQEEALTMSDRIVVMNAGKVEQIGTPGEIYETPATPFVAKFIGWCSLLKGTVDDAGAFTSTAGLRIIGKWSAGPATVVIRPEQLKLSADGAAGQRQQARVLHSHYLGGATRVVLDVNGEQLIMQERFPFGRHPQHGDVLDIAISTDNLRLIGDA